MAKPLFSVPKKISRPAAPRNSAGIATSAVGNEHEKRKKLAMTPILLHQPSIATAFLAFSESPQNPFENSASTFSIDVDTACSFIRRQLQRSQLSQQDEVYIDLDYACPAPQKLRILSASQWR